VGVAGMKLGSWLKTESNYPCLLSRTVAERLRYVPGLEPCMALVGKHWPTILSVTLPNYPAAFAVVKEAVHCWSQLA
jgi:hypothetical protein